MKIRKTNKFIKAFSVIVAVVLSLTISVCGVNAVPTASKAAASESSSAVQESTEQPTVEAEKDNEEEKNYNWSDNTFGNSSLIANQEILMDNGYYQFIAVTTRDDDMFYIIIDETKEENNVYFLNQVDTYDIQKLLGDDNNSNNGEAVQDYNNIDYSEPSTENVSENNPSNSSDTSFGIILMVGILILGVIGFVIFKKKFKGKKNSDNTQDDDDFDFDFEDEEINEDKENEDGKQK